MFLFCYVSDVLCYVVFVLLVLMIANCAGQINRKINTKCKHSGIYNLCCWDLICSDFILFCSASFVLCSFHITLCVLWLLCFTLLFSVSLCSFYDSVMFMFCLFRFKG